MRTADAVQIMALAADARVVAFIKEYQHQVIDPLEMQLFRIWERHETLNRIRAFLGRAPVSEPARSIIDIEEKGSA